MNRPVFEFWLRFTPRASGCTRAAESGIHFTDGSLAGSAATLQSGVALGFQITVAVND